MNILEAIKNKFGEKVEINRQSDKRSYVAVGPVEAVAVARYLFLEAGARFQTATGLDHRQAVEILYHFALDPAGVVVSLRVQVKKPELKMESLTSFLPAVDWAEREIYEMFGVEFVGPPRLEKLLLPDDWPAGVYPLRKTND